MTVSQELIDQVKFEEGLKLEAYTCPAGKKTIGYGRNLEAWPYLEGNKIPDTITKDQAEAILHFDLNHTSQCLAAAWHGYGLLQGARRDACIQMAFQLGVDGFLGFKALRKQLVVGAWHDAFREAMDSKWAKQTPNRARRVALQFITGEYYEV